MPAAQGRFVWYELAASDTVVAKAFYGTVVGWNMRDAPLPGMSYTLLSAGEAQIGGLRALSTEASDAGMRSRWVAYIAVDDVDDAASRLQDLGGRVHRAPAEIPSVGRFAVAADPQGAVLHLFRAAEPRVPLTSSIAGHVGWRELHTTDGPRALAFYRAMFGWGTGSDFDMGALGTCQQFTIDGTPAGGIFHGSAAQSAGFWLFYLRVADIDAATGRVTAAGGVILSGPQQLPGGGWIVRATDPQGAMFALLGTRP